MKLFFVAIISVFFLWSCGSKSSDKGPTKEVVNTTNSSTKKVVENSAPKNKVKLSADETKCWNLNVKYNECQKRRKTLILFNACKRDIKDPEMKPLQEKMFECTKVDCTVFDACYEKAADALRHAHYNRIRKEKNK